MNKKNMITVLLIFISISLNAQYLKLFLSGVDRYQFSYYRAALNKFNAAATCSDVTIKDLANLNMWIAKCTKKVNVLDRLESEKIEYCFIGRWLNITFNKDNMIKFKDIISLLDCFENFVTINLSHNDLSNIPKEIGNLNNLIFLYIKDNNLKTLPKAIGNLTNLQVLEIKDNNLSRLPKEIFSLKNIKPEYWEEMGEQLAVNKNFKQALNCFLKITEQYTDEYITGYGYYKSFDYAYGYAVWCYKNLGDTVNALLCFNKSFAINPKNRSTLIELDNLYYKIEDYRKCIEFTKKEIELKPTVRAYFILGMSYSGLKNHNEAIKTFKEALKLDKNAAFYGNLSYNYLFVNKPTEAIRAARQTLDLEPKLISVYTNLALAYVLNNEFDKAKTIYLNWKDKKDEGGRNFKEMFLKDIQDLEKEGVIHTSFEKLRRILK